MRSILALVLLGVLLVTLGLVRSNEATSMGGGRLVRVPRWAEGLRPSLQRMLRR